jgi:hypothetical protein
MPVMEGLLSANGIRRALKEERIIIDLLFDFATFHAFVKLRLHTKTILDFFDVATDRFLRNVRLFICEVCPLFKTKPLPKEEAAQQRRAAASAQRQQAATEVQGIPTASVGEKRRSDKDAGGPSKKQKTERLKPFNVKTSKWHGMRHYPDRLRVYGPTDNYSTLVVSDRSI